MTATTELALFGHDLFGEVVRPKANGPLQERFTFPPFTVLDAKQGEWQNRKRHWIALGIQSEIGRDVSAIVNTVAYEKYPYFAGRGSSDSSIFDPTLTELAYRWWAPPGGQILDPFAGGSVRGIVAGALGYDYFGIDLRHEQVAANDEQADTIRPAVRPTWVVGDSMELLDEVPDSDFIFSCPPYGDLERYSDDPADLSTMEWHTFSAAYRRIIHKSAKALKPNRFACFVVANFRDSKGHYRDLVGETVRAFEESGLHYYNEAVLLTSIGSAAMRATKQFDAGRKLCKTHQNVLVFVNGDWRQAAKAVTQHDHPH